MATGTVIVTVTKIGVGPDEGYRVEVQPWKVIPAAAHNFDRIEWAFSGVGVKFNEVSLDFKTKDHFVDAIDVSGSGPSEHWVLGENVVPPASAKIIGSDVKNPSNKNDDYQYIVNIEVVNGPKIEVDPGYRVWP